MMSATPIYEMITTGSDHDAPGMASYRFHRAALTKASFIIAMHCRC